MVLVLVLVLVWRGGKEDLVCKGEARSNKGRQATRS
jgi:hypothetical protein